MVNRVNWIISVKMAEVFHETQRNRLIAMDVHESQHFFSLTDLLLRVTHKNTLLTFFHLFYR